VRRGILTCLAMALTCGAVAEGERGLRIGTFSQEVATFVTPADGIPEGAATAIVMGGDGALYAAVAEGIYTSRDGKWTPLGDAAAQGRVYFLAFDEQQRLLSLAQAGLHAWDGAAWQLIAPLPEGAKPTAFYAGDGILVGDETGLFRLADGAFALDEQLEKRMRRGHGVYGITHLPGELGLVVATDSGLFAEEEDGYKHLLPHKDARSWGGFNARGVAADAAGGLWFTCEQGVGYCPPDGVQWQLYTAQDGLPSNKFVTLATGEPGVAWFGTIQGAIRFDGKHWSYRQGLRWLPGDGVNGIAVDPKTGTAWFATTHGLGKIVRQPMTLAEKAKYYEDEIDKYHRRTEYGYVAEIYLKKLDKSEFVQRDTDNDGLWTSMYGAGECFAYAATKSPVAKQRAKAAFEALRFLQKVTQGGTPPAKPGFIARTILPTSGPDPNAEEYTPEKDLRRKLNHDPLWKVLSPRWPKSADGKWYWKSDTSSDELDGHYFFYPLYYDLVADTEEEKERVRDVVRSLTDHFLEHDFCLVDWDGKPTRWAIFSPKELNKNPVWFVERGLNSLSMLSYLSTAAHITGDDRYIQAFEMLVNEHGYAMNLNTPKMQNGIGSGNQSDDEMAFMSMYNLVRYCHNPVVRSMAANAFQEYWKLEQPELNSFFNYAYAGACIEPEVPFTEFEADPPETWLEESLDTLVRFPLDRRNWGHKNSGRIDIVPLHRRTFDAGHAGRGHRMNGYALPVDERYFSHWNTDPWQLDYGGFGHELGSGAVFLLPYYMGLYHGFIVEE